MTLPYDPLLLAILALVVVLALAVMWLASRLTAQSARIESELAGSISNDIATRSAELQRALLNDLREGLASSAERVASRLTQLEASQAGKLEALKGELLAGTVGRINEQSRITQESTLGMLADIRLQFLSQAEAMQTAIEARLRDITGKVDVRLDEGFRKTNDTFLSVIQRLATIDEAQKKIDGLATNVVSLQQLLGDKRARGAFGEMQLEAIISNQLPETAYQLQYTFPDGLRADCVLKLPEPTGLIAVDAKFPLENFERMVMGETSPALFRSDVRKHVDDVATKYIIPGVTGDGAVMFIPAEAVFAEIHAHHRELVEYAQSRRVWLVSPTTMMAVLNTARAVLKDVETRKQVHVIKDELGKLGREFARFDERMRRLTEHIRQAHDDADNVRITSEKISKRFASIEQVRLDEPHGITPRLDLP